MKEGRRKGGDVRCGHVDMRVCKRMLLVKTVLVQPTVNTYIHTYISAFVSSD